MTARYSRNQRNARGQDAPAARTRLGRGVLLAVFRRASGREQVAGGVDQADVRKGLWKIAEQPSALRIAHLRQQPHVILQPQQALENLARFVVTILQRQVIGEPESA